MSDRHFKQADLAHILLRYVPHVNLDLSNVDMTIFQTAFTHKSFSLHKCYERLEFLGDSVNTAILTDYLYRRYSDQDEAYLTRLRSYLISGKVYATVSRQIGLPGWLRLGDHNEALRIRPEVQEDVYEAFVGALHLTFGFAATAEWVVRSFEEHVDISEASRKVINSRERLTNFCLSMFHKKPEIVISKTSDGTFTARVHHPEGGGVVAEGHARSAARAAADACDAATHTIMATRFSEF